MMDDLPEIVWATFHFSCKTVDCHAADVPVVIQAPIECTEITCGACGAGHPATLIGE